MKKKKVKEIKHLNHGDICNEIKCKLGIYNPETGDYLTSENTDNTTFKWNSMKPKRIISKWSLQKEPL